MNRGAQKRSTFRSATDRLLFLDVLGDAVADHEIEVHAYALMDNHYHLLLRTPQPNLSEAMRDIGGIYTQRFNSRHDVDGALFRGRFKAILVDSDNYLLTASRYIHRNPVEAGVVTAAAESRWTSYRSYLDLAPTPRWLTVSETLNMAGSRRSYASFVDEPFDPVGDRFYAQKRLAPVLGSESFRSRVASLAETTIPRSEELLLEQTDRAVEAVFASHAVAAMPQPETIRRLVSASTAREVGVGAETVAARYGFPNAASVRVATHRFRKLAAQDEPVDEFVRAVRAAIARADGGDATTHQAA